MSGDRPAPGDNVAICAYPDCTEVVDLNYDDHTVLPDDQVACLADAHHPEGGIYPGDDSDYSRYIAELRAQEAAYLAGAERDYPADNRWVAPTGETVAAALEALAEIVARQGVTADEAEYHFHQARLADPGDAHDDGLAR